MVMLIDTSVWIDVFRDTSGRLAQQLLQIGDPDDSVLTRFHQLELLQGCRDEREWNALEATLASQDYLEMTDASWSSSARIYYELKRTGRTVRSPIDCCIAQLALEHSVTLLHRDRDFETIAQIRPLRQQRLEWA